MPAAQGSSTQGPALGWQTCVHLLPEAKWFLIYILQVSQIQRNLFLEVTERVRATWRAQVSLGMGSGVSVSVCVWQGGGGTLSRPLGISHLSHLIPLPGHGWVEDTQGNRRTGGRALGLLWGHWYHPGL